MNKLLNFFKLQSKLNIINKYYFMPYKIITKDKYNKYIFNVLEESMKSKIQLLDMNKNNIIKSNDEIIYIASSENYILQDIYKIGRTKNSIKQRISTHNIGRIKTDRLKILDTFYVENSKSTEQRIHKKIKVFLVEGEREFFQCDYITLKSIIHLIIQNEKKENELIQNIYNNKTI